MARKTGVRISAAPTVAVAATVSVSAVALSLSLGLLAAAPLLQPGGGAAGGGAGLEEAPPGLREHEYYLDRCAPEGCERRIFDAAGSGFYAIAQAADGDYVMAGWAQPYEDEVLRNDRDVFLLKAWGVREIPLNEGNARWYRFYGGPGDQVAYAVIESRDAGGQTTGFTLVGQTLARDNSDTLFLKTGPTGEQLAGFPKTVAQTDNGEVAYAAATVHDGAGTVTGYLLVGSTSQLLPDGSEDGDIWWVMTDLDGNVVGGPWTGGNDDDNEVAAAVVRSVDAAGRTDGYVLAGERRVRRAHDGLEPGQRDGLLIRLTATGELGGWAENPKILGDPGRLHRDFFDDIRQTFTADGTPTGYVMAGSRLMDSSQAWLMKVDPAGNPEAGWPAYGYTFGGGGSDEGSAVVQTFDEQGQPTGYLLAGWTDSPIAGVQVEQTDTYFVRAAPDGHLLWQDVGGGQNQQYARALVPLPGNPNFAYAAAGQSTFIDFAGGVNATGRLDLVRRPQPPDDNQPFRRGDSDVTGAMDLTDPIFTLNYLFLGGPRPRCLDAADADDNSELNLTDAIFSLNYLFLGGPIPQPPRPDGPKGPDPTPDGLNCLDYPVP